MPALLLFGMLLNTLIPQDEPEKHHTLKNYLAAWSEANPTKRMELLEACYSPTGHYSDPLLLFSTLSALHEGIQQFHDQNPGANFSFHSSPKFHHNFAQFDWAMLNTEGEIVLLGEDFIEFGTDGKITRVTGFFEVGN